MRPLLVMSCALVLWMLPRPAMAQACPAAGADACQDWLAGLTGDSEGAGFWKHQLQAAHEGKTRGVTVTAAELDVLLEDIRAFGLTEAMYMDNYGEAVAVLEVVDNSLDGHKFGGQLLLAELNYFYGLGLDAPALQWWIMAQSELLIPQLHRGVADEDEVSWYRDVLSALNSL